jgi:CheY-like chemotaxis protein
VEERGAELTVPRGSERILFVDDEEMLVEMGKRMLEGLGYTVTAAMSSSEALELFQRDPARFDLVVTDQTMPEMTGLELSQQLLSVRDDIPVILSTGFSHLVDADTAEAAGIRAFVMKPLTRSELARTIRSVLDGKTLNQ